MRAILRRLRRDDSGLGMAELLVTAALTLLVLAMVGNMFISVAKITTASNQTRTSNDVASNIVNEVAGVLRVATNLTKADDSIDFAVVEGTQNKVVVYALSNTTAASPAPSKITFEILASTKDTGYYLVQETRCLGTLSGTTWTFSSACTTRKLGTGILPSDSVDNQLFTYRDATGAPMVLSSTNREDVASITVTVRAVGIAAKTPSVMVTNTVVLRNLGLDTTT